MKGKKCSKREANSFLIEQTSFQNGFGVQKSKQKVTKVVSLNKNCEKLYKHIFILTLLYVTLFNPFMPEYFQ